VGKVEFVGERCTGCGLCVAACPALAIILVNTAYAPEEALATFPYERLPMPKEGEIVLAVDEKGKSLTSVRVVRVDKRKTYDSTALVSVALPRKFLKQARDIVLGSNGTTKSAKGSVLKRRHAAKSEGDELW